MSQDYGYNEFPKNGNGIMRARTTSSIRSWEFEKAQHSLAVLDREISNVSYPGLYLLFDGKKIYVGEAKNVIKRLETHTHNPDKKISEWNKVVVINTTLLVEETLVGFS